MIPTVRTCLAACVLVLLCGCRAMRGPKPLSAPTVMVGVQNVSDTELARIERYFREELPRGWAVTEEDATPHDAAGAPVARAWFVRLGSWRDMRRLHGALTSLRDGRAGHAILASTRTDATLLYTSSEASSRTHAVIRIRVTPPNARLVFDSKVPSAVIDVGRPVATEDGEFELRLPFGFIRSARRYLYFHSIYKGQYRYYRYDLDTERQEVLPDVHGPQDFKRYRR